MKEKIIEEIKSRVSIIEDEKKQRIIKTIVNNDSWYNDENFDTVSSILFDLGYSKAEIKKIYITLITN